MSIVGANEPRFASINVTADSIVAELTDGRTVSVPLAWSWRLSDASSEQRKNFELIGGGEGAHWPDVDEDISARGMLQGIPTKPPAHPAGISAK